MSKRSIACDYIGWFVTLKGIIGVEFVEIRSSISFAFVCFDDIGASRVAVGRRSHVLSKSVIGLGSHASAGVIMSVTRSMEHAM